MTDKLEWFNKWLVSTPFRFSESTADIAHAAALEATKRERERWEQRIGCVIADLASEEETRYDQGDHDFARGLEFAKVNLSDEILVLPKKFKDLTND